MNIDLSVSFPLRVRTKYINASISRPQIIPSNSGQMRETILFPRVLREMGGE